MKGEGTHQQQQQEELALTAEGFLPWEREGNGEECGKRYHCCTVKGDVHMLFVQHTDSGQPAKHNPVMHSASVGNTASP